MMNNNKQISSFLIDEELQQSILTSPKKTQLQLTNQSLMKQLSELRTELRQLKHQNKWLQTSKEGQQQQCQTLKQLYNANKESLIQINSDMRAANQEINRLEDWIKGLEGEVGDWREKYQGKCRQERIRVQEVGEYRASNVELSMKVEYLQRQLQECKNNNRTQSIKQMTIFNDRLIQIVNRLDYSPQRTNNNNSNNKNNSSNSKNNSSNNKNNSSNNKNNSNNSNNNSNISNNNKEFPQQNSKYQSQSPSPQTKQCQQSYKLIQKLQYLLQQQKQNHHYYKQQTRNLQHQIVIGHKKLQIVEQQLREATDLLGISREEQHKYINKLKEMEDVAEGKKMWVGEIRAYCGEMLGKLGAILLMYMPDEKILLDKFINNLQTHTRTQTHTHIQTQNNNKYQLDLIYGQLKNIAYRNHTDSNVLNLHIQKNKRLQRKLVDIGQQLQLLKIKHTTLQRQYDAIVEDNRRIIKYHSLSQYRISRNMREYTININNKQNINYQNLCKQQVGSPFSQLKNH